MRNSKWTFWIFLAFTACAEPQADPSNKEEPVTVEMPELTSKTITVNEDESIDFEWAGAGVEVEVVEKPANGAITGVNGKFSYTPNANYHGADHIEGRPVRGGLKGKPAKVTIEVVPVNDQPVAYAKSITLTEDGTVIWVLLAYDVDGDELTFAQTPGFLPTHGTALFFANQVSYTPTANYAGSDEFRFQASDGVLTSIPATVMVNITPVNDIPEAGDMSFDINEDSPLHQTLTGSDVEGDPVTFGLLSDVAHGTLSLQANGSFSYVPNENFNGQDSFSAVPNDGMIDGLAVQVTINVAPANDRPVAYATSMTVAEDGSTTRVLSGFDIDGGTLTYSILAGQGPSHGIAVLQGNQVTYTPAANYHGSDAFMFEVSDGALTSTPVTVSVTVTSVPDAPVVASRAFTVNEDTPLSFSLAVTDVDNGTVTYSFGSVSAGSVSGSGNPFTYTPAANDDSSVAFTYRAFNGTTYSAPATITIDLLPVNDAPTAGNGILTVAEEGSQTGTLVFEDVDSSLTLEITQAPSHGSVAGLNGSTGGYLYTATETNFYGPDSFVFRVFDGQYAAFATVTVTVTNVDDPPVLTSTAFTGTTLSSFAVPLAHFDVDGGGAASYSLITQATEGFAFVPADGAATFSPGHAVGLVSFYARVTVNGLQSAATRVDVNIKGCIDNDGDLHGDYCMDGTDCDDTDPRRYAGAPELAGDGIAQSCGGIDLTVDEANGYFVDQANGNDITGDGTRVLPYASIAKGVDSAALAGKAVFIAAGTYDETAQASVSLHGGYSSADWSRNPSLNTTELRQITVPNGVTVAVEGVHVASTTGTGMLVQGQATIADAIVISGDAANPTGIAVSTTGRALLYGSVVTSGTASGVYSRAVYVSGGKAAVVKSTLQAGSGSETSAFWVDSAGSMGLAESSTLRGGAAANQARTVYSNDSAVVTIRNSFVYQNAGGNTSALAVNASSRMYVLHSTVEAPIGTSYHVGSSVFSAYLYVFNSILSGGGMETFSSSSGSYELRNCLLYSVFGLSSNNGTNVTGSIWADPAYESGTKIPGAGSPAIDAGVELLATKRAVAVVKDYVGSPRPQGSAVDIGPYERAP